MKWGMVGLLSGGVTFGAVGAAHASERHFGFSEESTALASGAAEVQAGSTIRAGRRDYYSAADLRLGLALGLLPNLQTALFWNFEAAATGNNNATSDSFRFDSLTSQWKYRFSDALADPVGFALLAEGSYGPRTRALGARLVLDKQYRGWLFAANVASTQSWSRPASGWNDFASDDDSLRHTGLYEASLAAGYFFTPTLVAGLEALSTTRADASDVRASSIYAGPSLAYSAERYWLVLSAAPQLLAPKPETGHRLDLATGERLRVRLVIGLRL